MKAGIAPPSTIDEYIGTFPPDVPAFKDELSDYATSKGAAQFPIEEPLPLELVTRIVKFRVAENEAKAGAKTKVRAR